MCDRDIGECFQDTQTHTTCANSDALKNSELITFCFIYFRAYSNYGYFHVNERLLFDSYVTKCLKIARNKINRVH